MKLHAVITGDIKKSGYIHDKMLLANIITKVCNDLKNKAIIDQFSIFRGDSFQVLLRNPDQALFCLLTIRSGLRKYSKALNEKKESNGRSYLLDARLSLGIGSVQFLSENLTMSNGQAFEFSGKGLDMLQKTEAMLYQKTIWPDFDIDMNISLRLADKCICSWTAASCEVLYRSYLYKENQSEISLQLGISQPAVNKRLRLAEYHLFEDYIAYFSNKMNKLLNQHV